MMDAVRPVPIVSRQHYVNLARIRALEFGRELVGPTAKMLPGTGTSSPVEASLERTRDDMVVTTEASLPPIYHKSALNGKVDEQDWDALEQKPRGFFADQFEVCCLAATPL